MCRNHFVLNYATPSREQVQRDYRETSSTYDQVLSYTIDVDVEEPQFEEKATAKYLTQVDSGTTELETYLVQDKDSDDESSNKVESPPVLQLLPIPVAPHWKQVLKRAKLVDEKAFGKLDVLAENGHFGILYTGTLDGTTVAIKSLKESGQLQLSDWVNFVAELRFSSILVKKFKADELMSVPLLAVAANSRVFGAFEFAAGGNVKSAAENPATTHQQRLVIAHHIAKALQQIHSVRIVHNDVAARNALLCSSGGGNGFVAKLCDFGLAVKVPAKATHAKLARLHILAPQNAPEEAKNVVNTASDIWQFGQLIAHLFVGASYELVNSRPQVNQLLAGTVALKIPAVPALSKHAELDKLYHRCFAIQTSPKDWKQKPSKADFGVLLDAQLKLRPSAKELADAFGKAAAEEAASSKK